MDNKINGSTRLAQHGKLRFLRLVVWLAAFTCLPLGILFALIPYSSTAWVLSFHLVSNFRRAVMFPQAASHRDPHCTIWDAWVQAVEYKRILAARRIGAAFKLLERDGDMLLVRTPYGQLWIPARDLSVLARTLVEVDEENVYSNGRCDIRPGDVVLDCGANVGIFTRRALKKGAKVVVAVEPSEESLRCLRRNVQQEVQAGRVIVYPKGVWDKDEELDLVENDHLASVESSVVATVGTKRVKVSLTTIDKIAAELRLARVDFIKMDIEGAEKKALTGAAGVLARFRPRMSIALEHAQSDPEDIPSLVRRLRADYHLLCGPCVTVAGHVQPEVLFAD